MQKPQKTSRAAQLTWYGISFIIALLLGLGMILTNPTAVVSLLASSIASLSGASTTIFFTPYGNETLPSGSTTDIDININTTVPINALGATIAFPKGTVEIVGISKQKSFFDLWTEDTKISEETGEVHFSGGTTKRGGLVGSGTLLTLTIKATGTGPVQLHIKDAQVFPNDSSGKALDTDFRSITYTLQEAQPTISASVGSGGSSSRTEPSADLNGDGKINLSDISILTTKIIGPYDPRYDLNADGSVNLGDLAVMFARMTGH